MISRKLNISISGTLGKTSAILLDLNKLLLISAFILTFSGSGINQLHAQDTTAIRPLPPPPVKEMHSPHKATIYAMVLPGLGQAYNKKYWKIPIVYAGFGTLAYFIHFNNKNYQELKTAYEWASVTSKTIFPPTPPNLFDSIPPPPNDWAKNYTEAQILEGREYYRRNLEISVIATSAWYLLTVVDAVVDAHFFDYDINEDLTLKVNPWMPITASSQPYRFSGGLNVTLKF